MCLSKAYVDRNGARELVMEEVASLSVEDGKIMLKTLFGERKEIAGSLREVDFLTHVLVLEGDEGR
ncbi:MAG: CooT family nickel-binding protein [Dehalococcoidales bacterium]|nr:CooT family nickel-binding protein [Dehalococcoidales bacterium]